MVVGLFGNKSPGSNRFTLVTPKSENDVRLQATLGNQNPTGLPVGAVRPNKKEIGDLQPESAYNIACKITGYTIEVETAPYYLESNPVSEAEFRRIVTENFEKFNNCDNYYGQNTSYASYEVKKKYSRKAYSVGFGEDEKPLYVKYGDNSVKFIEFVTSARTEEDAKKWCKILSKYKNIEDFRKDWQEIQKANEDKMIEALEMAGKVPLAKE